MNKEKIDTKLAFQKCKSIAKSHAIILTKQLNDHIAVFQLLAIEPILVNGQLYNADFGLITLAGMDSIQFPCESCPVPHIYHVIIPTCDSETVDQIHFNPKIFKPLLQKYPNASIKLQHLLEMSDQPQQQQQQ